MASSTSLHFAIASTLAIACCSPAAKQDEPHPPPAPAPAPTPTPSSAPAASGQPLGAFTRLSLEQRGGGPGADERCGGVEFSWSWEVSTRHWASMRCKGAGPDLSAARGIPGSGVLTPEVERQLQAATAMIRIGPPVQGNVEDGNATRLRIDRPDGSSATYLVIDDGAPDEPYAPTVKYAGSAQHVRPLTELAIKVALGLP